MRHENLAGLAEDNTGAPPEDSHLNDLLVTTVINAEDQAVIDTRISCTKEEAVIKLLGWMRGPLLKRVIPPSEDWEMPDSALPHYGFSQDHLDGFLFERRERAAQRPVHPPMLRAIALG